MALFCAAVRRDSVSPLRFPFFIHVQVFSCEISLICHLKYSYNCFSTHFCFLVILLLIIVWFVSFLVVVISLSLLFFYVVFESSYRCIDAVFNAGESSSIFFSWHILSLLSLVCKALSIVISFLVLWSICWSSFLLYFNYYYYYYSLWVFHISFNWWFFIGVWMTASLLRFPSDFNSAVVWMVSFLPLIFSSSSLFSRLFGTVPRAPITFGITATVMFPQLFQLCDKIQVFVYLFFSFIFTQSFARTAKFA